MSIHPEKIPPFIAIDVETADKAADSICAVGVVRVEVGKIVDRYYSLVRPPRKRFCYTHVHGIAWKNVAESPDFREIWPVVLSMAGAARFVAAHNATFEQWTLSASCARAGVPFLPLPFRCSKKMAQDVLGIHPSGLASVCRALHITLKHHDALSDAEACAEIVLRAYSTR